jgi:hypothetical protein
MVYVKPLLRFAGGQKGTREYACDLSMGDAIGGLLPTLRESRFVVISINKIR